MTEGRHAAGDGPFFLRKRTRKLRTRYPELVANGSCCDRRSHCDVGQARSCRFPGSCRGCDGSPRALARSRELRGVVEDRGASNAQGLAGDVLATLQLSFRLLAVGL